MRRMTSGWITATAVALACLLANTGAISSERPDIRGVVTLIDQGAGEVLASVLIEGEQEADTRVDKARVTVTTATKLFLQQGEERRAAGLEELRQGRRVEARFDGPVRESYPVQARAGEILIIEE
ncbi:MAG TPA: hypothetical protein VNO70_26310 [Blastocatellia bacterium]|nr:hypothetical protein [Blastocatellia bacterium]